MNLSEARGKLLVPILGLGRVDVEEKEVVMHAVILNTLIVILFGCGFEQDLVLVD